MGAAVCLSPAAPLIVRGFDGELYSPKLYSPK